MGNGNRTRNRRSHSPVLCQLSYSHRQSDYTTARRDHVEQQCVVWCESCGNSLSLVEGNEIQRGNLA